MVSSPSLLQYVHAVRRYFNKVVAAGSNSNSSLDARAFEYVMDHLPVGVATDSLIGGEFSFNWWDDECKELYQKAHTALNMDESRDVETVVAKRMRDDFHCFGGYSAAHTCPNYFKLIEKGLAGLKMEVLANKEDLESAENDFCSDIESALEAVSRFIQRVADKSCQLANDEKNPQKRLILEEIAENCAQIAQNPPRTVLQSLQLLWLVNCAVGVSEYNFASLSFGQMDQYLISLFEKDIASGVKEEELEKQISSFFLKLNTFGDAACAVNVGPASAESCSNRYNRLSAMIVRVVAQNQMAAPLLAVKIRQDCPNEVFDDFLAPRLLKIGQPSFYGEESCRELLRLRGVPEDELDLWAANSCMGILIQGKEISDMWGAVVNTLLPLELALNNGKPFKHKLPISFKTIAQTHYESYDELERVYVAFLKELTDWCVDRNKRSIEDVVGNPLLSALTDSCAARKLDRARGGAKYHTVAVENFAFANASDALLAIKRLVFERHRFSLREMVEAAKRGFTDCEDIRQALKAQPKYGNGENEADDALARLCEIFADHVKTHDHGNVKYGASFHTLNAHVQAGRKTWASLDGRRAGEPFAKNVGGSPGTSVSGHTALINSAAKVPQKRFFGGQALDISIRADEFANETIKRKYAAMIKTYFRKGGLQIQVNGVSPDLLRQAMENPDSHKDVLVRIAGYTRPFVSLGEDVQHEMIERFEMGL